MGSAQDNEITLPEKPVSAKNLFLKFDSCIQVNDIVNAVLYADTACQLYESYWTKKDIPLANVYRKSAELFSSKQQLDEASQYAKKAIEVLQHHFPKTLPEIGELYVSLGNIAQYRSLPNQAIRYFQQALDLWSQLPPEMLTESYLVLYIEIGKIYYQMREFDAAIAYYEQARKFITKQLGNEDNYNIATLYTQIGIAYAETDSVDKALFYLEQGSKITERLFNQKIEDNAIIYSHISMVHFKNRNYDSAIVYANKTIDVYESLPEDHHEELKEFKLLMARIYFWTEAYETSAYWYNSYLEESAKEEITTKDLAHLYLQTGGTFAGKMSMHHAITFYEKGLELYELANDHDPLTLASLFTSISNIYNELHYYDKALILQKQAAHFYNSGDSVENDTKINAYLNVANTLELTKEYKEEIDWLNKALEKTERTNNLKALIWNKLAFANYQINKLEEALNYALLESSFYIDVYEGIHINTASAYLLLGNIYTKIKNQDEAYKAYNKALHFDTGIFDQITQVALDANRFLSYLYRIKGNNNKADQHAVLAMKIQQGMSSTK
ncbi:tetratricopeptide repeat protein [Chondrinema litorale]|uniref:tetratricopeptide repeat protein n=1 Tax=Chondrinema litorale TaxID=2994555 RepID=UPI002544007B|nr:tetratricopeptide repeat protein [Chondrinema litorale]UZR95358.1 tetratricopeptide repeat protein [Chondrinema litorale]